VARGKVDGWERELAPSPPLLQAFRQERISWEGFAQRYLEEVGLRRELLGKWRERAQRETVTLLCSCRDPGRCHRALLRGLLEGG